MINTYKLGYYVLWRSYKFTGNYVVVLIPVAYVLVHNNIKFHLTRKYFF